MVAPISQLKSVAAMEEEKVMRRRGI